MEDSFFNWSIKPEVDNNVSIAGGGDSGGGEG
jgi:hypothetical protein